MMQTLTLIIINIIIIIIIIIIIATISRKIGTRHCTEHLTWIA